MRVEVGKAYKLQDGRDCFCYTKSADAFFLVTKLRSIPHYDTFTVDEQGVVVNDIDKASFGERILPFTTDSLDVL